MPFLPSSSPADAETSKAMMDRESQRKKDERARHKDYIHDSREVQRQQMRNKYTLDSDLKGGSSKSSKGKKTSSSSAPPHSSHPTSGGQGGQDGDKKCIVS